MNTLALTSGQVPKIGIGLLIGLVVVGVIVCFIVSTLVSRIVVAAVVIALGTYVWQQRTVIEHNVTAHKCQLNTQFFGIHVQAPQDVVQSCQKQLNK